MPKNPIRTSIYDVAPLEEGGVVARQGFQFQDHVAAGFMLEMLLDDNIKEVWCESLDDITLILNDKGSISVEFVQVKSTQLEHLWSLAELCKREKSSENKEGLGTSIIERSLNYDRYTEHCSFRIVTSRNVRSELEVLTLPKTSPKRTTHPGPMLGLEKSLKSRLSNVVSPNGHSLDYWVQHTFWDIRHSVNAIIDSNIIKIYEILSEFCLDAQQNYRVDFRAQVLRERIYARILQIAYEAAVAPWSINPEKKRICISSLQNQFDSIVNEAKQSAEPIVRHPSAKHSVLQRHVRVDIPKSPFISLIFAEEDAEICASIQKKLAEIHFHVWPQASEILSNSHGGGQHRVPECTACIVIVSRNSIVSSRVNYEVYSARASHKTVICLMVDDVTELPRDWNILQRCSWRPSDMKKSLGELTKLLPATAVNTLEHYLERKGSIIQIRELITRYPEWLPIEEYMHASYSFKKNVVLEDETVVDLIAARPDTGGIRCYMYYFASPDVDFSTPQSIDASVSGCQ
jgi:hypothetical protein